MPITDADMALIGKMIKARRIALGMSARDLAQRVGVSDTHIMYIERAQRKGVAAPDMMSQLDPLALQTRIARDGGRGHLAACP